MAKVYATLLLTVFLPCLPAQIVDAQTSRASDVYYLRFGQGLSDFSGDAGAREGIPDLYDTEKFTETDDFQYALVAELGYQFVPSFSLGVGYQFGTYYQIGGSRELQTAQLIMRYKPGARHWSVVPYMDIGATGSTTNRGRFAYGPSLGGGLDIAVNRHLSLFVEARYNLTFPDGAADPGIEGLPFDLLGATPAVGANMVLESTPTPVRVQQIQGPEEVKVGQSATYSATVNEESASGSIERSWTFGDGGTGSGLTAEHTFNQSGTYTVLFEARNAGGADRQSMTVNVTPALKPPRIASLQAAPNPATVGSEVFFRADGAGSADLSYSWRLGDGTTASSPVTSHTYDDPGAYTVELTVSNDRGETSRTLQLQVDSARTDPGFGPYTVQIGAFAERDNAERKALRVLYDGYPTRIRSITREGQIYYRVWAGSFETEEAAEATLERFQVYAPDAFVKEMLQSTNRQNE